MSSSNDILDAAADLIRQRGVRRVQLSEIARHAGVSRPTVYRRWPDVHAVIAALLTRQVQAIQASVPLDGTDRPALVAAIVATAVRIRDDELLGGLLLSDPDVLAEYTVQRLGTSQRGLLEALRAAITRGQKSGTIRRGRAKEMAAMVLLIAQSTVQSHRLVAQVLPDQAWRRELATALNGYLAP
ncbi:MAG TPA: helix-turn-helix domain-containing protein [Jatrophihabitantaceae bacterium]|jgi:AcrR family transcriptional regulator